MNRKKIEFTNALLNEMQTKSLSDVKIYDICQTMNCSRQSFYYYFDSIESCFSYLIFDVFEILDSKNINYRKNRHNFIDCNINGYDFTIDNENHEIRIKNLLETIKKLSKENEELKKDNKLKI